MSPRHWVLIGFLSCLWGAAFFFNAVAVRDVPTLTIVLVRVAGGALVLMLAMAVMGTRVPSSTRWWDYAVMGLLASALPFVLIVGAQTQITSGLASVLNASAPIFSVLVAHAFGAERATGLRLAGVFLGFCGVAVLIGPSALAGDGVTTIGMLAVLAGTLSYGFASLWGRRFKDVPPLFTSTAQLGFSAAFLLPLALIVDRPWTVAAPGWAAIGALAGLAVLSTALAFVIFFRVMAEAGAINAMLVSLLIPLSATLLGVVVLGEAISMRQVAGAAVIGCALLILDGRLVAWWTARRLKTAASPPPASPAP